MRAEIAELKKRRQMLKENPPPPEETISAHEELVRGYEDGAIKGDNAASQFLWLQRNSLRDARRKYLWEKWGEGVFELPDAVEELRAHSLRMAELKRVHLLARSRHFPDYVKQVEALMERERSRHETRMQQLKRSIGIQPGAGGT